MFELFDFSRPDRSIYKEVVDRFAAGAVT